MFKLTRPSIKTRSYDKYDVDISARCTPRTCFATDPVTARREHVMIVGRREDGRPT